MDGTAAFKGTLRFTTMQSSTSFLSVTNGSYAGWSQWTCGATAVHSRLCQRVSARRVPEEIFRSVVVGDIMRFQKGLVFLHPKNEAQLASVVLLAKIARYVYNNDRGKPAVV